MPTGDVLGLAELPVPLVEVVRLIIVRREVVSIDIEIDRLIVLHMGRKCLLISYHSTLSALIPRSPERDL